MVWREDWRDDAEATYRISRLIERKRVVALCPEKLQRRSIVVFIAESALFESLQHCQRTMRVQCSH